MKLRTSFRGKLLLLSTVPLAVAQVVTLFVVMQAIRTDVAQRTTESLVTGGAVVDEYLASRSKQLRTDARALAADLSFQDAVATGDRDAILSALDNRGPRVAADIFVVLDVNGKVLANSGNIAPNRLTDFSRLIELDNTTESASSTSAVGDDVYQTITVPVEAPVTIAWIVSGLRVDDALAERLASLTGLDIGLVSASADAQGIIASSASDKSLLASAADYLLPDTPTTAVYTVSIAGVDWLALRTPFEQGNSNLQVVVRRSMQEAMLPYVEARNVLTGFVAILLVLVASSVAWVSGGIARPLHAMAVAARRVISGRYDRIDHRSADDEVSLLATSFNAMQSAIADREQRISHQAMHDPLTDLPNRYNVMQHLNGAIDRAKSSASTIAVVCVRLSSLNAIAATLGHNASDQVVTLAARHLRLNLHPSQVLGHIGSSEFVLILPKSDVEQALNTAELISDILGAGVTLDRVNIRLRTEVGIAVFPHHATGAAELLRNAAIARSEAEARREPVMIYENGREDHYLQQLRIVNDLRTALARDEVHLHFQPKVSLPDGFPTGVEALVRWDHPEFGSLSPDQFVPAAEQAGTIVHLTRYVVTRAIEQCRKWQDRGHALHVSVNLSARDLHDEYLPHYVDQALTENEIDPQQLTLEITENTMMDNFRRAVAVLEKLRGTGVRISMDDFGIGNSSLTQLKAIPLDELKIDRSFVTNMLSEEQNEAIVMATLELAHNLKLRVVAEGVEDEATIRRLAGAGCEEAQGFFLSKPLPFDELVAWLDGWHAVTYGERRGRTRAFRKKA